MKKVSVIIPTYNRAKTLLRSVDSVLHQTYSNLEVIIVDDGSRDETAKIVKSIQDTRIVYIKCENNQGASAARNIGVEHASGEMVAFQDSDDVWKSDKLEKQMKYLEEHLEFSMVYCPFRRHKCGISFVVPNDMKLEGDLEGDIFHWLLLRNTIGTPTMVMYKQCFVDIGGFDTALRSLEDWEMVIRFAEKYQIGYLNEVLMDAYYMEGGISSGTGAFYESRCKMIAKYKQYYVEYGIFDDVVKRLFQQAQEKNMLEMVKKMLMLYLSQS